MYLLPRIVYSDDAMMICTECNPCISYYVGSLLLDKSYMHDWIPEIN